MEMQKFEFLMFYVFLLCSDYVLLILIRGVSELRIRIRIRGHPHEF